jgi:hypothetical protein
MHLTLLFSSFTQAGIARNHLHQKGIATAIERAPAGLWNGGCAYILKIYNVGEQRVASILANTKVKYQIIREEQIEE